jgi:hypothetical protein
LLVAVQGKSGIFIKRLSVGTVKYSQDTGGKSSKPVLNNIKEMKITILSIALICGCLTSTYSQINQNHKRDTTVDKSYDIKPNLGDKSMNQFHNLWSPKTADDFLSNNSLNISRGLEKEFMFDNMPCYKPEGLFSMRIRIPDPTLIYTMLIRKY